MTLDESIGKQGESRPLPHRWRNVFGGLGVALAGMFVFVSLAGMDLADGTRDLRIQSAEAMQEIDDALDRAQIYCDTVAGAQPALSRDDVAVWWSYRRVISAAGHASGPGIEQVVRRSLHAPDVYAQEEIAEDGRTKSLTVLMNGRSIATIVIKDSSAPWRNAPTDLVAACERIFLEIEGVLDREYSGAIALSRGPTATASNDDYRWGTTTFVVARPEQNPAVRSSDLPLTDTFNARQLADTIRTAFAHRNIAVVPSDKTPVIYVYYEGVKCAIIILEDSPATQQRPRPDLANASSRTIDARNASFYFPSPGIEELPLESEEIDYHGGLDAAPKETPAFAPGAPRVAIIVDDGGYGGTATEIILGLEPVLTLAILPNTPYGTSIAKRAYESGFEVMLHMPMESPGHRHDFPGQLETYMTQDEITKLTLDALDQISYAVGVNNHTGSKFTADRGAMRLFFNVLQEMPLFFVDSQTTGRTIAYEVAQEMGIPSAARDVFLDNRSDPSYIRGQFEYLIRFAKKHGSAIGICHFRPNTAVVLRDMLPVIRQEGIELVFASEMIP